MRLDKFLGESTDLSRSDARKVLKSGEITVNGEVVTKGTFCARAYKEYPGLYDVLYLGAAVHENRRGLVSHFTLAGVSMEMAMAFTRKFLAAITWN